MAAKKKRGRPKAPRKRLGKKEAVIVRRIMAVVKKFEVKNSDKKKRETSLNARLIKQLKAVEPRVVNRGLYRIDFIGQKWHPECTLSVGGHYSLFSLECKKLHDHSRKRLFKEGLAQANVYLTKSKVVALVLYDFTKGRRYAKAFGKGNTTSSRFAARVREELGLHIVVRPAP